MILLGLVLVAPRAALAVEWQNYLEDDFDSPESMFYAGQAGEAEYSIDDEGHYIVDGLESGSDSLSALTDSLYYYYVQSDCQVLESTAGDLAFCGIVFHYHKLGDGRLAYYVFYTYGDGYYGAKRVIGTDVEILLPLKKTDLFNPDGYANTLAVDAQGTRFNLYINGDYVDGFTDMQVDGGGFGFYISKNSRGAFDNFKVKTEKRGGSKRDGDEPSVADDEGGPEHEGEPGRAARGYFGGYEPPAIPKDPDRPLYPWEVGYDKSYKKKIKQKEIGPEDPQADESADDSGESGDDDSGAEGEAEDVRPPAEHEEAGPRRGGDDGDSDYIPGSPVQAVPDDDVEEESSAEEPRRSAKPDRSKKSGDTDKELRSADATRPDGRELGDDETGAEEEENDGRRKAKGGKLEPTDGFRETGGPALPASEQKESDRQVRPPRKGDKAPFRDEPMDDSATDEATVSEDDEPGDFTTDAGIEAADAEQTDTADDPILSAPEVLEGGEAEMLRPEPGASGDESAAGDESEAGADTNAEAQAEDGAEQASEQPLELKPELPSKGKPKGKGKGKGKAKPASDKGKKGKGAKDTKSKQSSEDKSAADDSTEDSAEEPKAEKDSNADSGRRRGLKTGGDDWDTGSGGVRKSSDVLKNKAKSKPKGKDPAEEGADTAAPLAADESGDQVRPPTADEQARQNGEAEALPAEDLAAEAGSAEAAPTEAAPLDEGNAMSDVPAADETSSTAAPLDGFSDQQDDAGLPAPETVNDSAVQEAGAEPAQTNEAQMNEAQADEAPATELDETAAESLASPDSQARPPARELPGDQPEVDGDSALSGSLLLDYVNVSTVQDDFSQPRWPVADNGSSSYSYSDEGYELNNIDAQTMAISYQQDSFVDSELSCDASFISGESAVGYGLAGRFRVEDGAVSYYALFVSASGEVLLLKVLKGEEIVLSDWTATPMLIPGQPNRLTLELVGNTIRASINGELVSEATDSDISGGGYALLAGPGVAARYDELLLRGVRAQ